MIYVAVSVLWLASSTLAELAGGLRTILAGEKKRDFGLDDLTTLPCSECLVEWLGRHASRKTQRKDSNDSLHVCFPLKSARRAQRLVFTGYLVFI